MIYNFFDRAKEANLYEKDVAGIDIDDIGNLENLSMKNMGSLK